MEEDTSHRSLQAITAIAIGILIIGAGCSSAGNEKPPQQSQNETSSSDQANAAPQKEDMPKAAVPFIACYRGEADLFSSTKDVSDIWVDQLRQQLNDGWIIDIWCRKTDASGASQYGLALRRSQGVTAAEIATSTFAIQQSGKKNGSLEVPDDEASQWSLIKLAYIPASRNRSNEIPLIISNSVAVKNEAKPVENISLIERMESESNAPGFLRADIRGGGHNGWFSARLSFEINTNKLVTDQYCRMYFDNEDGSFSPEDAKLECDPAN
jgi:hypothetical protein